MGAKGGWGAERTQEIRLDMQEEPREYFWGEEGCADREGGRNKKKRDRVEVGNAIRLRYGIVDFDLVGVGL